MYVLAIDQGTTGTTAILYDEQGAAVDRAYQEFTQHYPQPGWVEHDAEEIWQTVVSTAGALAKKHVGEIAAVGITNQRETTVLWDRKTHAPVHRAIVWQCRRTAERCEALAGESERIRARTGLPVDAYFSGTKLAWLLEQVPERDAASLAFGTIDTWLIWKLTGGTVHATDFSNASRTMLFNIHERIWDTGLCELIGVPEAVLPEVRSSSGDFGTVSDIGGLEGVPICGVAGDQQSALFGQTCFAAGEAKNTYGTGCFLLLNTGDTAVSSEHGLLTTLAVNGEGQPCYALEGSVFIAGAALQWVRDELGLIDSAEDSEAAAVAIESNEGVYLVPAFVGLGAPHWDMKARGVLVGLTRGSGKNHIIRAALEAMAYQSADVIDAMVKDIGQPLARLAVDGGAVANTFLMQFQADVLNVPVDRPANIETTSLGAAYLAGLHAGVWRDAAALRGLTSVERTFEPAMDASTRDALLEGWAAALRQARTR